MYYLHYIMYIIVALYNVHSNTCKQDIYIPKHICLNIIFYRGR